MKQYLPELDLAFSNYWKSRGEITVSQVNLPVVLPDTFSLPGDSVFDMMFDNAYPHTSYNYLFEEHRITEFPKNIIDRLSVKCARSKCYISSEDSTSSVDLLLLSDEEISMLDTLLDYRAFGIFSLDTTGFSALEHPLSQSIYIYLDVIGNHDLDSIDLLTQMSPPTKILDILFDIYVTNECHKFLKDSNILMDNDVIETYINRKRVCLTEENIVEKSFEVNSPLPISKETIFLYFNGTLVEEADFTLEFFPEESPVTAIIHVFDDGDPELKDGDCFIIEYQSYENVPPIGPSITTTVHDSRDYKIQDYIEVHLAGYPVPDVPGTFVEEEES